MATKADKYLEYLEAAASDHDAYKDYIMGAEGQDADHDGDPEYDCSGLHHAALTRGAGVKDTRTTANGYKNRSHKIKAPTQAGDFAVLLDKGTTHAHHLINYSMHGKTIEAKGHAYGIVRDSVAHVNSRGGIWYRDDSVNKALGAATALPAPAPKPIIKHVTGCEGLNLRKSARMGDNIIMVLRKGWGVFVSGHIGEWSKVKVVRNGKTGYVATKFIK
jgi:hypothetical protein